MPDFRYQSLGPLPSPGGTRTFLGLAILDETRAQPVVLVWVPDDLAQDLEKSDRLRRETERAALLEHPHIVRVYGFSRLPEGLARVVEFADGENLRRVLEKTGPLPPPLATRLIADAAQGVHYAHLAGNDDGTPLLHGDIRPDTLLLTFKGHCKISGYGASAFAPKENRARTFRLAPEQVLGGRAAMNVQTDVYLLGATLFEALTGKAPFEDEPDFEQAVLARELNLDQYSQIPPALVPVLTRALAKKAADRYPSALAFREALEEAVQPLPSHDELAQWLSERFPDKEGARAERQQMIDAAIAKFAREQWAKSTEPKPAPPPAPPVAATPPPPPAPPAPAASAPGPRRQEDLSDELEAAPTPRSPRRAILLVASVAVLAAIALVVLSRRESPKKAYPPELTTRIEDAGAPMVAAAPPLDAGASDAGALAAAPQTVAPDAGTTAAAAATAEPAKPSTVLALTVEPRVNVEIDGQPAGRAPLRIPLAPGRHRVRLTDRAKGVDLTRIVMVNPSGVTTEEIYLQKGFVSVTAPPGALIEIDDLRVGKAPIKTDVPVYEGSHRIQVTVGTSKWRENFTLKPNQRVYFDVGPQYQ